MGSENMLPPRRCSAQATVKRIIRLAALAAFVVGFAPSRAAAQATSITACQTTPLSGTVNVTASITVPNTWTGPCLTVGTDNVTVDLLYNTINITALGDNGVAIDAGAFTNTTIEDGTILTAYSTSAADTTGAIEASGGTNLNINTIKLTNEPTATPCTTDSRSNTNYGIGILLDGVSGGSIGGNTVTCFQKGLLVENSSVPRKGTGSITGNTLTDDTYDMAAGGHSFNSGGLILSYSNGWTVTNNTIEYTGSYDTNYGCAPVNKTLSCAFALQIIDASSDNSITTNNTVRNNFFGGIMTGSDTARNDITGNTVLNNTYFDIYAEGNGHGNNFRGNTCLSAGGSLRSSICQ